MSDDGITVSQIVHRFKRHGLTKDSFNKVAKNLSDKGLLKRTRVGHEFKYDIDSVRQCIEENLFGVAEKKSNDSWQTDFAVANDGFSPYFSRKDLHRLNGIKEADFLKWMNDDEKYPDASGCFLVAQVVSVCGSNGGKRVDVREHLDEDYDPPQMVSYDWYIDWSGNG